MCPVDQLLGDEFSIRNNDHRTVIRGDLTAADTDLAHRSDPSADLDHITDLHGLLKRKHDARHQITYHILQTETNTHTQRTKDDGQSIRWNPRRSNRQHEAYNDDA